MYTISTYFFLLIVTVTCKGATVFDRYLQAHNAYVQQNYKEAVILLRDLPGTSFPVLYNLGCAYAKSGNNYEALKAFFKAARISSGPDSVRAYDSYVQMQKNLGIFEQKNGIVLCVERLMRYMPTLLMQCIALLLLLLMLSYVFYWRSRKLLFSLTVISLFCMFVLYQRYRENTSVVGFAKHATIIVRTGPDEQYAAVSTVPQGTQFSIVSKIDLWYRVDFNQQQGWVRAADTDLII